MATVRDEGGKYMGLLIAPFRMMIDLGEVVVIALLGIALIGLFI